MSETGPKLNELELECGVTLHLQAVKQWIVMEFLTEMGIYELFKSGNVDDEDMLSLLNNAKAAPGITKLMSYVAGWGVTDDVPTDTKDDLAALGGGEYMVRSRWVREVATASEISLLFGQVLALTFKK